MGECALLTDVLPEPAHIDSRHTLIVPGVLAIANTSATDDSVRSRTEQPVVGRLQNRGAMDGVLQQAGRQLAQCLRGTDE